MFTFAKVISKQCLLALSVNILSSKIILAYKNFEQKTHFQSLHHLAPLPRYAKNLSVSVCTMM